RDASRRDRYDSVDFGSFKFGGIESVVRRVDKEPARSLKVGARALWPAQRREIPIDWLHRMTLANSRALEDPRNALEIVVAPAESPVHRSRDVGLAQDVRWNRSSQRNKLGRLAHRHSHCDRDYGVMRLSLIANYSRSVEKSYTGEGAPPFRRESCPPFFPPTRPPTPITGSATPR